MRPTHPFFFPVDPDIAFPKLIAIFRYTGLSAQLDSSCIFISDELGPSSPPPGAPVQWTTITAPGPRISITLTHFTDQIRELKSENEELQKQNQTHQARQSLVPAISSSPLITAFQRPTLILRVEMRYHKLDAKDLNRLKS